MKTARLSGATSCLEISSGRHLGRELRTLCNLNISGPPNRVAWVFKALFGKVQMWNRHGSVSYGQPGPRCLMAVQALLQSVDLLVADMPVAQSSRPFPQVLCRPSVERSSSAGAPMQCELRIVDGPDAREPTTFHGDRGRWLE